MYKKIVSLVLVICMMMSMSAVSFAKEVDRDVTTEPQQQYTVEEVKALEAYISVDNGKYVFDVKAAKKNNVDRELIKVQVNHLNQLNQRAENNDITICEDLSINNNNKSRSSFSVSHKTNCGGGVNSYEEFWWGYTRYACDCETNRMIADFATAAAGGGIAGGTAAAIAIIFPVTAPIAGAIAAGLAIDTGYWSLFATRLGANNEGDGVIIDMTIVGVFDIEAQ